MPACRFHVLVKGLVGLSSLLLVAGCGDSTGNPGGGSTTAPSTSRVNSPITVGPVIAQVRVTVPDGWKAVEKATVPAQYLKDGVTFIAKTESYATTELDPTLNQALTAYKSAFANVAVQGQTQTLKVDGHDARKLVFTCEVASMKMKYINVFTRVGGQTWVITFGGGADSFDKLEADYQAILDKIKFE
jgi:hypothetical protein